MIQIIPAINVETWNEVVQKIRLVEPFSEWVHIDVADGSFAPNTLWHNPLDLTHFETKAKIELHLMVDRPEEHIEAWLTKPVDRVIVHFETAHDMDHIIREGQKDKIEIGLSVAPHTSWTHLKPYLGSVDVFQILAVDPGEAGQEFDHPSLIKIKHLRAFAPQAIIEVDGGITPEIGDECIRAGANILVSASYIFKHPSPKMAIKELIHSK